MSDRAGLIFWIVFLCVMVGALCYSRGRLDGIRYAIHQLGLDKRNAE